MILQRFRENRARSKMLGRARKWQRDGEFDQLRALLLSVSNGTVQPVLHAMLAHCYVDYDDRKAALVEFGEIYKKYSSGSDLDRYVKLYALFNLALLRGSEGDAVYYSNKTREANAPKWVRWYLPVPLMRAQPRPGPAITATL